METKEMLAQAAEILAYAVGAFESHDNAVLADRAGKLINLINARVQGMEVHPADRLANVSDSFVLDWAEGIISQYIHFHYTALSKAGRLSILDDVCLELGNLATELRGGKSAETDAIVDGLAADLGVTLDGGSISPGAAAHINKLEGAE